MLHLLKHERRAPSVLAHESTFEPVPIDHAAIVEEVILGESVAPSATVCQTEEVLQADVVTSSDLTDGLGSDRDLRSSSRLPARTAESTTTFQTSTRCVEMTSIWGSS